MRRLPVAIIALAGLQKLIFWRSTRDFFANQILDLQEYFVYFKNSKCRVTGKDPLIR